MSLIYNRLSKIRRTLVVALLFLVPHGMALAQSTTRPYQLTLWECCGSGAIPTSADVDIRALGTPLTGPSIMLLAGPHATESLPPVTALDWSQIAAVEYDEPYASIDAELIASSVDKWGLSTHCANGPAQTSAIDTALLQRAAELKALAPKARFWVNLTDKEAGLVEFDNCWAAVFNKSYIDVISADWYDVAFSTIQPFYSVVARHPPKPDQQLALIPGTFSAPTNQAPYLQDYLDYATHMNQTCNLPLGSRGVTGIYDGCPVWIVMGYLTLDDGAYRGILDGTPGSQLIHTAWQAVSTLTPATTTQRVRAELLPAVLQIIQH